MGTIKQLSCCNGGSFKNIKMFTLYCAFTFMCLYVREKSRKYISVLIIKLVFVL